MGAHVVRADDGEDEPFLEVTRSQHEQRVFPVRAGQEVTLGVRRLHVLPTPLSSFTVCAPDEAQVETLKREPLLATLAARMKTRVVARVEPVGDPARIESAGDPARSEPVSDRARSEPVADPTAEVETGFSGAAVIAAAPGTAASIEWLLERGAEEVLILPRDARAPQRALIHCSGESARRATLAVAASLLRHLPAEAVYVGILPEEGASNAQRPLGMRALLDARSEAQAIHGLAMRTELRFGDAARELSLRLAESPDPLLVLGIGDCAELAGFAALLEAPRFPLIVVYRPASQPAPVREPARAAAGLARLA